MTLLECTCQSEETLEQHFEELNRQHVNGQGTLKLIERLREFPDDRTVFALTSVDRLCLLSQDDYTTPWWVVITSHSSDDFKIECRLPHNQAPWRGAKVLGETKNLTTAVEMVVRGLMVSRGWNSDISGQPIGLDEILEESLSLFRVPQAEERCRELLRPGENQVKICPATGSEILVTPIVAINSDECIGYRHDASETSHRWGLFEPLETELSAPNSWYYWLDEAFCHSSGWSGSMPA